MPPSSKEEIERQHKLAIQIVQKDKDCSMPIYSQSTYPIGKEIPLSDKVCPTIDLFTVPTSPTKDAKDASSSDGEEEEKKAGEVTTTNNNDATSTSTTTTTTPTTTEPNIIRINPTIDPSTVLECPSCFSTLGHVDVTELQKLIREGYNQKYDLLVKSSSSKSSTSSSSKSKPKSTTNYWDPINAKINNVSVTRPSHDSWGINKIVLIFSDDFIYRVYHFPWLGKFHNALQPVIQVLPSNAKIIRLLFASLPTNVTIPIHHDTGEWVKMTHRIHCPIIVDDVNSVLFRCGPTPNHLQRIDCTPGHVFELNNQSKHTVSNCSTNTNNYRVHLILDYIIEDDTDNNVRRPPIIQLSPGEKLIQSRRSIDRYQDIVNETRPSPSFIILGAQKAGTTSLYEYIMQHPWVARPTRRETHCFDWRWPPELMTSTMVDKTKTKEKTTKTTKTNNKPPPSNDDILLHIRNTYFHGTELLQYPSCLTGDSTPSYLLDSYRVIPRIKQVLYKNQHYKQKLKFMILVRNPIKRAESHYAMVTSTKGTPAQLKTRGNEWRNLSFEQVVMKELEILDKCGLIPYWNIQNGTFDESKFNEFCDSKQEQVAWNTYMENHIPLNTGSYGLLTRGLYALQIQSWFSEFDRNQFLIFQLEKHLKNGDNSDDNNGGATTITNASTNSPLHETMKQVWDHLDLPYYPVVDSTPRNTREYESMMDSKMKEYLERFFQPHNRRLYKLLSSKNDDDKNESDNEWYNVWDCRS